MSTPNPDGIARPRIPKITQVEHQGHAPHPRFTERHNPVFQVHSIPDNGLWDSERGHLDTPYFDPTITHGS